MLAKSKTLGEKAPAGRELMSNKEESRQAEAKEYSEEDVVWAKLEGYPWWPAIIKANVNPIPSHTEGSKQKKSLKYSVEFLGDRTHAEIDQSKLVDYLANRDHLISQGKTYKKAFDKKSFDNAIEEADFLADNPYESSSQNIEQSYEDPSRRKTNLQKDRNKAEGQSRALVNQLSPRKEKEPVIQKEFTKEQMSSEVFRNSAKHLLMQLKAKNTKGAVQPLDLKKLALKMLKRDLRIKRPTRNFIGQRIEFDNWTTIKDMSLPEIFRLYNFKPQGKQTDDGTDQTSRDTIPSHYNANIDKDNHQSAAIPKKTKAQPRFQIYVNEFGISTISMATLQQVQISIFL